MYMASIRVLGYAPAGRLCFCKFFTPENSVLLNFGGCTISLDVATGVYR